MKIHINKFDLFTCLLMDSTLGHMKLSMVSWGGLPHLHKFSVSIPYFDFYDFLEIIQMYTHFGYKGSVFHLGSQND